MPSFEKLSESQLCNVRLFQEYGTYLSEHARKKNKVRNKPLIIVRDNNSALLQKVGVLEKGQDAVLAKLCQLERTMSQTVSRQLPEPVSPARKRRGTSLSPLPGADFATFSALYNYCGTDKVRSTGLISTSAASAAANVPVQ
jgi:hypothetical protein